MKRNHIIDFFIRPLLVLACVYATPCANAQQNRNISHKKKNILFIAIDDLRPELACYGMTQVKTPHIDKLAQQGNLFENAYCQQAVCAPSRNSVLTGLRPDAMQIYDLGTFFRTTVPDVVTLPQLFKENGYIAENVGKIYHVGHGNKNDLQSWTTVWNYRDELDVLPKINHGDTTDLESSLPKLNGKMLPYYRSNAPDEDLSDGRVAAIAAERIEALKDQDQPFFLGVGFTATHLPFVAPSSYWDLYDPLDIAIPSQQEPSGMYNQAFIKWSGELAAYHGIAPFKEKGTLPDSIARNLIQGYYASVSFVDAQVGKLLDALEKNGLRENTIVVLWGDHGYKLGEYGMWCKHSNAELDTRAPLIIRDPDYSSERKSPSVVELLDIYPTLCELTGIQAPDHLQGKSLVPILNDPGTRVKEVAMSQWPKGKTYPGTPPSREIMGYSITDGRYRFTRWQYHKNPKHVIERELYDHTESRIDTKNLAKSKKYEAEVRRLESLLNGLLEERQKTRITN
ncbi:sulfatase [Sphingobacterium arenae]|uniref:Sulfatase n=1 Tax=Sphingobacterium arenae TaxID=1280598 RepID=A0ABR7XYQ7_9SPHI|nr:sulfatase [Sphingobacterium arenae]MBD1424191.1 sulfatase [Sphingobacterium arenae]